MIEVYIKKMPMLIDDFTAKDVYRVDYRHVNGYWRTFGIYEAREMAEFVAENINTGHIQV